MPVIPNRLRVRNFMCYGEDVPELDFSGIHVAGLVGDNGHGKSALLDAITWALWGRARTNQDDKLIRQGQTEMEVDLEFTVEGQRYRVIRRREMRARSGRTDLQLQAWTGSEWQLLTEPTTTQTEQRILSLLRLDYETFINSAFLVQGEADRFTTQRPGERKRILGEILGLSQYDEYQKRARERARRFAAQVARLDAEMAEADRELAHEARYRQEEQAAREQVEALERDARRADKAFRELEGRVRVLEERAREAETLSQRLAKVRERIQRLEKRLQEREERHRELQSLLARREKIQAGLQALEKARARQRKMLQRAEAQRQLEKEKQALEQERFRARQALESEANTVRGWLQKAEERARAADRLQEEVKALQERLTELEKARQEQETLQEQRQALATEKVALEEANARLREEMQELRDRLDLLQAATDPRCPLCQQALPPQERSRLIQAMTQEGADLKEIFLQNKERLEQLAREEKDVDQRLSQAARALKDLLPLQRQLAAAEESLAQARKAAEEAAEYQERLQALEAQLKKDEVAPEVQERLAKLEEDLAKCAVDPQEFQQVDDEVQRLSSYQEDAARLKIAEEQIGVVEADIQADREQLEAYRQQVKDDAIHLERLQEEVRDLEDLRRSLREQEKALEEVRRRLAEARDALGAARQRVAHCEHLKELREQKAQEREDAAREQALYEELDTAFGKQGVQALLIDQALPEITEEANRLLARMTDGRMRVDLQTQRETKSGTTQEVLDIIISDELGSRPYELYSGGEAFRVNFALRVALSRLLARRAGAPLQTLFIDEGFGTLDAVGRERLVEAIGSVQDDFACILVVTHVEELKEMFPVRIEVTKGEDGSHFVVR